MMRVPLGAVSDTPSGKIKSMIVDTVEKLEKYFKEPVLAKIIRLYVMEYVNYPSLRWELHYVMDKKYGGNITKIFSPAPPERVIIHFLLNSFLNALKLASL